MKNLALAVVAAAVCDCACAGTPMIVDVDGRLWQGVGVSLEAGRYVVRLIGPDDGGTYTAWNAWNGLVTGCDEACECSRGWLSSYSATGAEFRIGGGLGVCETPQEALALGQTRRPVCFELAQEEVVVFQVADGPANSSFADNEGGVSLLIEPGGVCPEDCNDNGFNDDFDISSGSSADTDDDGVPDECAGCSAADLAEPYGLLDLSDLTAFISAFVQGDPIADLDPNGLFDLADVTLFVSAFTAGCG